MNIATKIKILASGSKFDACSNSHVNYVTSRFGREITRRSHEVMQEMMYHFGFTRLDLHSEMVLFSEIRVKNDIMDKVLSYFAHRFPTFVIGLYSNKELFVATYRDDVRLPARKMFDSKDKALRWLKVEVGSKTAERVPIEWEETYWENYYDT